MKFDYDLQAFGKRLQDLIDERKITPRKLAAAIQADGVTIHTWVIGKHYPNGYYIVRLCKVLDVSADYLLFGGNRNG